MFKKLRTVVFRTTDLAAARDWYIKIIGIHPYFDQPYYVGFDIDGSELGLDPDMEQVTPGNHTLSYWAVESVTESLNKLSDQGARIIQPRTNVGGDIHVATVEDPFGNQFGIIEGA